MKLWGDLETYCTVPIQHGTYRYAEECEVMIFTYAFDDGPVELWDLTSGAPMPGDLDYALNDTDCEVWFQNSMFDRTVLRLSKNLRVEIAPERWHDTMVQALSHSMPGALDKLCEILNIEQDSRKHKAGKKLIHLFCKPVNDKRVTRLDFPDKWKEFCDYAKSDITAMRAAHTKMPSWNYKGDEYSLWLLDQKINDRGICIDVDLVRSAISTVDAEKRRLADRTQQLTSGQVQSAAQRDSLLAFVLEEYGIDLPDMQAPTLERRIADPDLPWALRELLAVRLQATMASTAKYNALMRGISANGRLCGTKQFNGANRTGRWAGRMFQPDNLPRPDMSPEEIMLAIEAIKAGCADLMYDNVMRVCSNAIRGVIVAPKGKKLVVSDLSNIEGRKQAWYAGEQWKLQAFTDYDNGDGPDLYKLAYAKSFGITPEEVKKDERQIGKVQELALGYQGGVAAFIIFASAYNVDLAAMAEKGFATIPADILAEAESFYEWRIKQGHRPQGVALRTTRTDTRAWVDDITKKVYIVCDSFKRMWRAAHPLITAMWPEIERAVRMAINHPGTTFPCGPYLMRRDGAWLRVVLPSGRALCYPNPRVSDKDAISYMGVNQYTRKWQRIYTYGGKLFENFCQAGARDVMAYNMARIEEHGYEIVLTVHDEVITEAPDDPAFNEAHLSSLLARVPHWAEGLPLSAGGFSGYRYRKE